MTPYGLMNPNFPDHQGLDELEVPGEVDKAEILSPQQYAMLMNSMGDPLAMYTASFANQEATPSSFLRPSAPPPPSQFDPMEMYDGHDYNISPTYGHVRGMAGGHGQEVREGVGGSGDDDDDEGHPMYTMMSSAYQPRPPTAPRNPQSSRH